MGTQETRFVIGPHWYCWHQDVTTTIAHDRPNGQESVHVEHHAFRSVHGMFQNT
ncbi:hypothetical protein [Thermosporothrix hazakensis]|uniref:hypothetical protein n=1 Tax=Thermosporothrix hazakensis TaxID=644383 RepID=UPI001472B3C0|nr:hypothetical protein [Thermosporothrix hazakensis]